MGALDQTVGGGFGGGIADAEPVEPMLSVDDNEDGSVVITFGKPPIPDASAAADSSAFTANLALKIDSADAASLAARLLEGIDADVGSRKQWEENYSQGLEMLGLTIDNKQTSTTAHKNMATVRHPLLLHSCIKFQAGARGEMLPASGPIKIRDDNTEPTEERTTLASDLETDLNHYLTTTATEYYPDTDRALFYLAYGGTVFKKVYRCPIRNRPVSESVYAPDLIVSNDATDLANAERVTHRIEMNKYRMEEMKRSGVYADVALMQPTASPTPIERVEANISGIAAAPQRPEDAQHVVYECYTRLIPSMYGLGKEDEALPYRISIERDSRKVLDIRRNWRQADKLKRPRRWFVKFDLIRGMGFMGYGYVHILGNYTKALTAILRLLIDAGMFNSFPGGLISKQGRMDTNELQPGPGEFVPIETGGAAIQTVVMPLPYKEPSNVLFQLFGQLQDQGAALAGVVDVETGDGRANVPVGTIMAQIEQQTQVMTAVHKNLHQAQQEEFMLLKALFVEDPEAISRGAERPKRQWSSAEEFADLDFVPASDPNVPAQVHRIMQATVVQTLAAANPQLYNQYEVDKRSLKILGVGDIDSILPPPVGDPSAAQNDAAARAVAQGLKIEGAKVQQAGQKMQQDGALAAAKLQLDAKKAQADAATKAQDQSIKAAQVNQQAQADANAHQQAEADRVSRERIAAMNDQNALLIAGIGVLGQQASADPVNDDKVGPE